MTLITFLLKVKRRNPVRSTGTMLDRCYVSKLEAEEKSWCFKNILNEQLRTIHFDRIVSIDEKWEKMRDSIKTVSEIVLGKPKKNKETMVQ